MKFPLLIFTIVSAFMSNGQGVKDSPGGFDFQRITFHTSDCNGTCPFISINIYKDRTIELSRTTYISKGLADTTRSGNFKGSLREEDYVSLLTYLKQVDWETVNFPKVDCCDRPVRSIIIAYNGKTRRYRSMEPPKSTLQLIDFLTRLGTDINLPAYKYAIRFEDIPD